MKTYILTIITLLVSVFSLNGQDEALLIERWSEYYNADSSAWIFYSHITFDRDENGDWIGSVSKGYSSTQKRWFNSNKYELEYNSNRQRTYWGYSRWEEEKNDWVLRNSNTHTYDADGCLQKTDHLNVYWFTGDTTAFEDRYEYYDSCLLKNHIRTSSSDPNLGTLTEYTYEADNSLRLQKKYLLNLSNNQTELIEEGYSLFNLNGDILEYYNYRLGDSIWSKVVTEYDVYGNGILTKSSRIPEPGGEELVRIDSIVYHYNADETITSFDRYSKQEDRNVYEFDVTRSYDYFCDKRIKNYYTERFEFDYFHSRTSNVYDRPADCPEEQEPEMSIIPNPTSGPITVSSPLFYDYTSRLLITDLAGKTIRDYDFNKRSGSMNVLITDLLPGAYVFSILTSESRVAEIIIVQ